MIDTITMRLGAVEMLEGADLTVEQGRVNNRTGEVQETILCRDVAGSPLIGTKAYHNANDFNLTLDPFGWKLQTSLPKLAGGGINFYPVDGTKARESLELLEEKLGYSVGVISDLSQAKIIRADLFRNGEMSYPPNYYFSLLQEFSGGRRMQKRDYGDTVLFHNTQRECCFYDKLGELRIKHKGINTSSLPKNILRAEVRMLNGRVVRRDAKLDTVAGLIEHWPDLSETYQRNIKSMVFNKKLDVPSIVTEIERLKAFKERGGRQAWQKAKASFGLYYFASRYSQREFEHIVREVFGRFVARKAVREYFETQLSFSAFDAPEVKTKQLYDELYVKLVA